MNRQFVLQNSPVVARQLRRLKQFMPEIDIDLSILQSYEPEPNTDGLNQNSIALLQDILDFDLRGIIALKDVTSEVNMREWLLPIIKAAQFRGITDIAFTPGIPHLKAMMMARQAGLKAHFIDTKAGEDLPAPRSSVLVMTGKNQTYKVTSWQDDWISPLALEFPRTIIMADTLRASSIKLNPHMPTLMSVFNKQSRYMVAEMAFLFNTSYAISRS